MDGLLKIKVCGMVHPKNIEDVCRLNPDFLGYIFYPASKRFVGHRPDPYIFQIPQEPVRKVGVFVNEQFQKVSEICRLYDLDCVQLHGSEPVEYCRQLKGSGFTVIKAIKPDHTGGDWGMGTYEKVVDYFLFDTPSPDHGGTGLQFDWSLLTDRSIPLPFFLSGGLGPGDVKKIGRIRHESLFGVDINSGFESSPGIKRSDLLKQFFSELRTFKQ